MDLDAFYDAEFDEHAAVALATRESLRQDFALL